MPRPSLKFGPYRTPRFRPGDVVFCGIQGEVVIVRLRPGKIPWPIGARGRKRVLILYADLAQAVRRESAGAIAAAWEVGNGTVSRWRRALGVKFTAGQRLQLSEGVRGSDPERAGKIATAKRGKARPPHVIAAMHKRRPVRHTQATKAKMSAAHKARGTRPPWLNPAWTAGEDELVRTLPAAEAAKATGRSYAAVKCRRRKLGVSRRWTRMEDYVVRSRSPAKAAAETGRTLSAVLHRRHVLGVNDGPAQRCKGK